MIRKISYTQQTNRVLEIESKVDVIEDMNQSKVSKTKQMQSNASFVVPITVMIELNVPPQAKLVLNVANKDILPLSVWKRIVSQVCQPTRYITQV